MNSYSQIPRQHTGASSDTTSSVKLTNEDVAQQVYKIARENLMRVSKWHLLAGPATADFQLVDSNGNFADRQVQKGDYLRIDIPGPGTAKDGYDWVVVEDIDDQTNHNLHCWTIITVRPSPSPLDNSENTKHFFSEEATSNFIVERKGLVVTAAVFGRNEKPNTASQGILETMRNTVVALTAMLGLNKPQWKSLADGILSNSLEHLNPPEEHR